MDSHIFLGIDIGGTKTSISIGDDSGRLLGKRKFSTRSGVDSVVSDCHREISLLLQEVNLACFDAIGISCGGPLDSKLGIIQSPPNLPGWDDIPIVKIFEERYHVPVYLENDANACALAEWYWGNGRGSDSIIFLTFGTGLGAGLILDGKLYRGTSGLAGEIGHWRMTDDGPYCYYKRGSWESFCSGSGIAGLYEQVTGKRLSAKDVCEAAKSGEVHAVQVIDESARMLGVGLALLVDLLNPQTIIIGSIYTRDEELFKPLMDRVMLEETLSIAYRDCTVLPSLLGEQLGDMAALGIAMERYA